MDHGNGGFLNEPFPKGEREAVSEVRGWEVPGEARGDVQDSRVSSPPLSPLPLSPSLASHRSSPWSSGWQERGVQLRPSLAQLAAQPRPGVSPVFPSKIQVRQRKLDWEQHDKILQIFSRSANRDQCNENCPEIKVTKGEKNKKKKKKKDRSDNKKEGKKGKNRNRKENKKNKRMNMKGKKTSNKENSSQSITSRFEETKLDDSKTEVTEDFGPFGNFLKSLITRNTYL